MSRQRMATKPLHHFFITQAGTTDDDEKNKSVFLEETTTSRQYSDARRRTTFFDHDVVVSIKGGHPATAGTNNKHWSRLIPGTASSDEATSDAAVLGDHDAIPGPPPLHRWTGYSTRFTSYDTTWSSAPPFTSLHSTATPASTDLDGHLGSFLGSFFDTTTGNLAFDDSSFESSGEMYPPQGILDTPDDNITSRAAPAATRERLHRR